MNNDRYIAAIEISSAKIIGAIGKTRGNGDLDIIALEQEKCVESVRYGIIQNLDETSTRIARIINKLERNSGVEPRRISRLFVGLSGRSLRSISSEATLNLPAETEIDDNILTHLRDEARRKAIDSSLDVVDAVPGIFTVGKTETRNPKGLTGNHIKGSFDLIVCRSELMRNLSRTITDKAGIKIERFVVTNLAAAHLVLKPEEKRLGCMLVDMGAETTTVSIYKDGGLRYFATVPLGGRNITRDLTTLNVLEERAEEVKIQAGNAVAVTQSAANNLNGLKVQDVNNLVVARAEEIVANVVEQMVYAGLKDSDLSGGMKVMGGASKLTRMTELLANQSNLSVSMGQLPQYVNIEDTARNPGLESLEVISIAYAGATLSQAECLEDRTEQAPIGRQQPVQPEQPVQQPQGQGRRAAVVEEDRPRVKPHRRSLFEGFKRRITTLFSPPEDDESD
ncbi:MAG: cell division protein FtsA, partial [Muribaculaceae bacterium]|nr:cell division protein FtsA [Muribaculaceae bacterium]